MEQPLDLAHGTVISELRYKAWGEVRYASAATPTKYTYTGQYSYASDFGLLYYNARWLDPALGRFAQADAIISSNGQGFDRYLYTNNNPIRFIDPSGHKCVPEDECEGMSNGVGFSVSINWTGMIADKFGVTLSGNWTPENAHRVYASLTYMNVKLAGGKLAMFTAGTGHLIVFRLTKIFIMKLPIQ